MQRKWIVHTSNHYGRKCHSNLWQSELCNDMLKAISDIMVIGMRCEIHLWLEIISAIIIKKILFDVFISNNYGRKFLSNLLQLEPYNDMFNVMSDIMAHSYQMLYCI